MSVLNETILVGNEDEASIESGEVSAADEDEDVPADFFDDFLSNDFMDGLDVVDAWDDANDNGVLAKADPVISATSNNKRRSSKSSSPVQAKPKTSYTGRYKRRRSESANKLHADKQNKSQSKNKGRTGSGSRSRSLLKRGGRRRSRGRRSRSRSRNRKSYTNSRYKKDSGHSRYPSKGDELSGDSRRDPEKTKRDIEKDKVKHAKHEEDRIISEKLKVVETGLVPPGTEMEVDIATLSPQVAKKDVAAPEKVNQKGRSTSTKPYETKRKLRGKVNSRYKGRYRYSRSKSKSLPRNSKSDTYKKTFDRRGYYERSSNYSPEKYKPRDSTFDSGPGQKPRKEVVGEFPNNFPNPNVIYYNNFQDSIQEHLQEIASYHTFATVPAPVPPPSANPTDQYFPPVAIEYDQQFFIGQAFPEPVPYQVNPISDDVSIVGVPFCNKHLSKKREESAIIEIRQEKDAINKLFEDKKISLSDFLSMSAKHADLSRPINIQKKIKVISLCQDAIKACDGDPQFIGRFLMKNVRKGPEKVQEGKFISPLRKTPFIRFSYTTLTKSGEERSTLKNALNKILNNLGRLEAIKRSPVKSATSLIEESSSQKIGDSKIILLKAKLCQTDPVKCQLCEIRKTRNFVDKEIQCAISYRSFGTQTTEDESSRLGGKTSFKNQSIAHLTPAQLMRQTENQNDPKQLTHFASQRIFPEISPEAQNNFRQSFNPNRAEFGVPDFSSPGRFAANFNSSSSFENRGNTSNNLATSHSNFFERAINAKANAKASNARAPNFGTTNIPSLLQKPLLPLPSLFKRNF
ncbi:hypothetical protein FQA39_LY06062 [Lamprigera yunnana]|nr:hypothetical protein FQA39_LY06062 [Lamprigera yunnana]